MTATKADLAAENARLRAENEALRGEREEDRRKLTDALTGQAGIAAILRLIGETTTDLGHVMQALIAQAAQLIDADGGLVWRTTEVTAEHVYGWVHGYPVTPDRP